MGDGKDGKWALQTTALTDEERAKIMARQKADQQQSPFSLLIYGRDGVQAVPLTEGRAVVIGRSPPADVAVRDDSLSRQHAHVELVEGKVWIEDLKSTNGTWIDGERKQRAQIGPGTQVVFGAVTASLHLRSLDEDLNLGIETHDRWVSELELETTRAKAYHRKMALVMMRGRNKSVNITQWIAVCREQLRPFDRMALYSPDTVEILLAETDLDQAVELANLMIKSNQPVLCGVGSYPDQACSAEELMEVTRIALLGADEAEPVVTARKIKEDSVPDLAEDGGPVVESPAMQQVYKTIDKVAASAIPVLINGETGTGKEVIARAIHAGSDRNEHPIVSLNCGAIPSELVESSLFGHEKGAFTGADRMARGVFEAADKGSVLLDEIGELPPSAQASLLRVLETKKITRVGSTNEIEVDVRILAATHKNLEAMVAAGSFRQDLLFRLNVMTLTVPPLRDRPEEIEPLTQRFMKEANATNRGQIERIDHDALDLLRRYPWPGNVRELRNAIERAVVIAQNDVIRIEDLPERVRDLGALISTPNQPQAPQSSLMELGRSINLKAEVNRYEAGLIMRALRQTEWDRKEAADLLGIPLRTLAHKIQVHDIQRES